MQKLKVLSLFSGIGAWEKAFERLNIPYELIGFCEKDENAIKSYCAIHNIDSSLNLGDVTQINEKSILDCDVITYSPPCQAFSLAGKQLGFEDKRGILFFDALRIIKDKQPKYAIMENVKGLTTKTFKNEFEEMLKGLDESGYNNYFQILNAKDYNVAQNRERIFIVSIRKDIDDHKFEFPKPIKPTKQLKDYLEEDAQLPILHNIYGGFKETKPRIFNDYSPTIRTSAGGGHIPSVYIVEDFYKNRPAREYKEYAPTLRSGRKGLKVINGKAVRQLTTLEVVRLMDFDDEDYYKLKEMKISDTQIYKLCGNSIAVGVLEAIFKNLLSTIII